jgi:uncharacterized damage-inducible protein DinB
MSVATQSHPADSSTEGNTFTIAQALLAEFERELETTRKFLSRVPEDQLGWRPHEKSMTAGQLALHIAMIPRGVVQLVQTDVATAPDFRRGPEQPATFAQVLETLESSAAAVRELLPSISDERMGQTFKVTRDGATLMSLPRVGFLRSIMLNHWYHHRGQLGVYLRLLGAKVPSSYGPSGDESPFG